MSQLIHAVRVLLIACTTGVIGPGAQVELPARARCARHERRGEESSYGYCFSFRFPRVSRASRAAPKPT